MFSRNAILIILAVTLAVAGAAVCGSFSKPGEWYAHAVKPALTPPSWVFGPVWSLLYLTMIVAASLLWIQQGWSVARWALALFALQLIFNAAWSPLFFGLHNPGAAFVDIVALWICLVCTVVMFFRLNPVAGWLLVPYLLWVSFASLLNFLFWKLNS